jgi:predicted DNA-binding transcriptional regulator AlpA
MHIDRRAGRLLAEHVSEGPEDEFLTTRQVADWLGCSMQWLEILRGRGTGPKYVTLSNRMVRYKRGAVRDWLRKRERQCTAEYARRTAVTR